jgi:RNA polymerase sigma factor
MKLRSEIDYRVTELKKNIKSKEMDGFIKEFQPFIVSCASDVLGRYISMENDDGYEIANIAFYEAIRGYDFDRGSFISFAKLIIRNNLLNYIKTEKNKRSIPMEAEDLESICGEEEPRSDLVDEILLFEKELLNYGITISDLEEKAPKHGDARKSAKELALKIIKDDEILNRFLIKRRLPVTSISGKYKVSRKVIYGNREYIISIIVIYINDLNYLKEWL